MAKLVLRKTGRPSNVFYVGFDGKWYLWVDHTGQAYKTSEWWAE